MKYKNISLANFERYSINLSRTILNSLLNKICKKEEKILLNQSNITFNKKYTLKKNYLYRQ